MSRLDGIIRLRKWELDDKRRILTGLREQQDAIQARIDAMQQELADVMQTPTEVGVTSSGAYLEGFRHREILLQQEYAAKEEEIQQQLDIVQEAFNELKTFEVAREREREEITRRDAKTEQDTFDEIGLRKHYDRSQ